MAITTGTRLGPYEIAAPVGAGGMGEVYRAHDSRLGRDVAVKVLPQSFAQDAERMRRFEQEARAVAALSHPNVLAVFDVGTHEGTPYLVSELLEGESLRERIQQGPIPQRKAVEYAIQAADGLAAAHEKGMVHRDLKPDNLFLTSNGRIKILDFGLAKFEQAEAASNVTAALTAGESVRTAAGVVLGTASYMSPEQVRGLPVDARSDLFSLGTVIYEMLTGNRAFNGQSAIETMNAILKEEPAELDAVQMKMSPGLERIIRHCLEKNAADRFQSARDLRFALGALSGTESATALRALPRPASKPKLLWMATAVAVISLAAVVFLLVTRAVPHAQRLDFAIPLSAEASYLAISPDGKMLTYVSPDDASGGSMLVMQPIGAGSPTVLPGTEGASYPFWSPDDSYVAFFADNKLKKIAASGGAAQVLATSSSGRGGSWGSRGVIVYAADAGGPLWKVQADGSAAAPLTDKTFTPQEASHRWPLFLPDGDHFLFWAGNFNNAPDDHTSGIYLSSVTTGGKTLLVPALSNPGYADGFLFYLANSQTLMAIPLDISRARTTGEAHVIGEGVGFLPSTYWGSFTAANDGTLVYSAAARSSFSALTWYDRTGKDLGRVSDPGVLANPTISPDGNRVSADITDVKANNVDVWIADLKQGTTSRFTFDPSEEVAGIWSRDGSSIAFRSAASGANMYVKKVQGLEAPRLLFQSSQSDDIIPNSWSSDDQQILCTLQLASGGSDLVLVPSAGGKPVPLLATKASETNGQVSPDGRWVAYASNESGDWEIYVTNFPGASGKWQVSRGGGTEPRWRGDGKEIFYIGPHGTLTAVPVVADTTFSTGAPTPLFQFHGRAPVSSTDLYTYDVTKDGRRFLVNRYVKPEHIDPLHIVLNATAPSR
ncbi:MAG: serine/threonine-protein kinase [Acidobacteriia bacterium]|nr:serine/threonine-protein kinase [Terriglobia bacterium]